MFECNNYKTDTDLELHGVWVDFIGDARIKVASLDNPQYLQRLFKESKSKGADASDTFSIDAEKVAAKRFADTIFLDWENFTENGEPLEYSKEKAAELLISIKPLFGAVNKAARNEALYRQQQNADIEKN